MNVHDQKVIQKMIEHTEHILSYTKDIHSLDAFSANDMLVEACVFNLVQIGELAHSELSNETKKNISTIPWHQIYGLRNRIVHGYAQVSLMVVWETIQGDIKPLQEELKKSLQKSEKEES